MHPSGRQLLLAPLATLALLAASAPGVAHAGNAPTPTQQLRQTAPVRTPDPTTITPTAEPAVPEEGAVTRQGSPSPQGGRVDLSPSSVQSLGDTVGTLNAVGGLVPDASVTTLASLADRTVARFARSNRYLTNIAVSQEVFPNGSKVVLVANGEDFPDGLAASAVAVALNGPLILTPAKSLPAQTAAELTRLNPTKIILAGSTGAVSDIVLAGIRSAAPAATVIRAGGNDRFATAHTLATFMPAQPSGSPRIAFVASGMAFPDALTVGAVAGERSAPLLLTTATSVPFATRLSLSRLRPSVTYVIGDQMSSSVLSTIRAITGGTVEVLGGPQRYDTAARVAQTFYAPTSPGITIVPGLSFPDALSAAALAHRDHGPILLDPGTGTPAPATVDASRALSWYVPTDGRTMRYIPVAHPDDDMSSMAVNAPNPGRYDVFILLTSGNTTNFCTGQAISNPWRTQEFIPQPEPTGTYLSDLCTKNRRDSWDTFNNVNATQAPPNYTSLTGKEVQWNGQILPTPRRMDPLSLVIAATDIRVAVGPDRAFVQFDLGALTQEKVMWAILNTRLLHGTVLPGLPERDIVGAGFQPHCDGFVLCPP